MNRLSSTPPAAGTSRGKENKTRRSDESLCLQCNCAVLQKRGTRSFHLISTDEPIVHQFY